MSSRTVLSLQPHFVCNVWPALSSQVLGLQVDVTKSALIFSYSDRLRCFFCCILLFWPETPGIESIQSRVSFSKGVFMVFVKCRVVEEGG